MLKAKLKFGDKSFEIVTVESLLPRLKQLHEYADLPKAKLLKPILLAEAKARGIKQYGKLSAAALATALQSEFQRLEVAVLDDDSCGEPEGGSEPEGGGEPDPGGEPQGGGGAGVDEYEGGGGGGGDGEEVEDAEPQVDEEQTLQAQLRRAATEAKQQQLRFVEKKHAELAKTKRLIIDLVDLLRSVGYKPEITIASDAQGLAVCEIALGGGGAPPVAPTGLAVTLQSSGAAGAEVLAPVLKACLRRVTLWELPSATKLLLFMVRDYRNIRSTAIARYGINGQMCQGKLRLAVAHVIQRFEAAAKPVLAEIAAKLPTPPVSPVPPIPPAPPVPPTPSTCVIEVLVYDGEKCNIDSSPNQGQFPHSLYALALHSEKLMLSDSEKLGSSRTTLLARIREVSTRAPLPRCLSRAGLALHAVPAARRQTRVPSALSGTWRSEEAWAGVRGDIEEAPLWIWYKRREKAATRLQSARRRHNATVTAARLRVVPAVAPGLAAAPALAVTPAVAPAVAPALAPAVTPAVAPAVAPTVTVADARLPAARSTVDFKALQPTAAAAKRATAVNAAAEETVATAAFWKQRAQDFGLSKAVLPSGPLGRILNDPGMRRLAHEQARMRPVRQPTPLERVGRTVDGGFELSSASDPWAAIARFDHGQPPPPPTLCGVTIGAGGRVKLRVFSTLGHDPSFVDARQMLKAQQMEQEEAQPSLSLAQLKDELLLAYFERERARLTSEGHDFNHYFLPPQGALVLPCGRRLEIQCSKHKDKNGMQVLTRQKVPGLLNLQNILAVARRMHTEDPANFPLVAAFIRTIDMQDSSALAWPMLSQEFQAELALEESTAVEATYLSALGGAHMAFDMPGLPIAERVRLIEVVRQNALLNAAGDALFLPFGGGKKRERDGEPVGVRSGAMRGLAGTNLRAMLEGADVVAALRVGNSAAVFETMNLKLTNTDHVEFSFSVLSKLGGGFKGELDQACQTFRRADIASQVA